MSQKRKANPDKERDLNGSRRNTMSSTLRCLEVLDLLANQPYEFSLSAITAKLGIAKGSAHRLVATLCESGLVEQNEENRRYLLAPKAFWVGTAFLRHSAIYRAASPQMQDLVKKARGMAHLAVWHRFSVLYLHTISHPSFTYLFAQTGELRPVHCTALGKALLAHRPSTEIEEVFRCGVERSTEKTILHLKEMQKELRAIRSRGFAVDDEESVAGVRCVAAPIRDSRGSVVAAISLSAPSSILTKKQIPVYANVVAEAGLRASVQLGFRPASSNLPSVTAASRESPWR